MRYNTDERRALPEDPTEAQVIQADIATAERRRSRVLACAERDARLAQRYEREVVRLYAELAEAQAREEGK